MADNNPKPHTYQDDTGSDQEDKVTEELTDDPTKLFGVPPKEFKDELDKDEQIMEEHGDIDPDEMDGDETQH